MISFLFINKPFVAPCCLHINCIAKVKLGERYPNRVVNFELNRAYMKIRTPNSCCTDNTWFFEYFYGFLGFVVWEISGHFGGVYQSRYCASDVAFLFSFVYVIHLNIAFYLYGKQIKPRIANKLYLQMIFICVRLNWLDITSVIPCPLTRKLLLGTYLGVYFLSKRDRNANQLFVPQNKHKLYIRILSNKFETYNYCWNFTKIIEVQWRRNSEWWIGKLCCTKRRSQ